MMRRLVWYKLFCYGHKQETSNMFWNITCEVIAQLALQVLKIHLSYEYSIKNRFFSPYFNNID